MKALSLVWGTWKMPSTCSLLLEMREGLLCGSGGPASPSLIFLEEQSRTPGILNLCEYLGVLAPPRAASISKHPLARAGHQAPCNYVPT